MEAVVILACEGFGEILTSDSVSELRRLKIQRAVFKSPKEMGGERVHALKMKNGDAKGLEVPEDEKAGKEKLKGPRT